ncbi:leukocyte elastase inhibitor-like isoform X1 [Esox lucius]|uniref:Serpin B6 n=1 Tax=Esox lucius TaxID=8010 RepID=A0A3P8Z9T5_ESOLU|nr:leukocyte elastase inhibitor-like isoform X1 [Esox lucius]XP_019897408.2 leukocyte elastase inhibitor-like isoform X1 [Esox lucius]
MSSVSVANTNFSLDLFKKITEKKKTGNVFYSPLSISSALAMVSLGARGNTATQMSEVLCLVKADRPKEAYPGQLQKVQKYQLPHALKSLHLHKAKDDVHVSFSKLMGELNKEGAPYKLSLANRLYGEQSYKFVETFLHDTKKHYNAELEAVDFKSNAETARQNINTWVEKQTADKIKDLLPKGIVDDLTRLVLVNAIYFKGNWEKKFKETSTKDVQFRLNKNESKPVKMMHQKAKFPLTFIPEANCQILELPYVGNQLSMLIMLPNEIEDGTTGLEKLEKELTYDNFVDWTKPDMMDLVEVQVGLPKFKLEESLDMKETLVSMGMIDAFDHSRSDFSGMSPNNDLVLSKVVHKAFVEVNEEGTEAAAATAAIMMMRCALRTPTFFADHPFLFFIRHNPTQSILFYGRYSSP